MSFTPTVDQIARLSGFYLDFVEPWNSWQTQFGSAGLTPIDPTAFLNIATQPAWLPDATGKLALSPGGAVLPWTYSREGKLAGIIPQRLRTNLWTQSETFATSASPGATISTGQVHRDPKGGNAMVAIYEDNSNGLHGLTSPSMAVAGSSAVTASIYLRMGERQQIRFSLSDGTTTYYANIDLTTLQLLSSSGLLSYYVQNLGDGMVRLAITAIVGSGATAVTASLSGLVGGTVSYTGTPFAPVAWVYGGQCEIGQNASSYIPAGASAVSRSGDVIKLPGAQFAPFIGNNSDFAIFGRCVPRQHGHVLAEIFLNTPAKTAYRLMAYSDIAGVLQSTSYDNALAVTSTVSAAAQGSYSPKGQSFPFAARFSAGNRKLIAATPDQVSAGVDQGQYTLPSILTNDADFVIGRYGESSSIGAHTPIHSIGFISGPVSDDRLQLMLAA